MRSHPLRNVILFGGVVLLAAAALSSDGTPSFRPTEKAFYADEQQINFIRPGLLVKVTKAEIAADGTITAWVTFTDPKGVPLDTAGIETPGTITSSFLVASIPAGGTQYRSYITRKRTGGGNTVDQATGENTGLWTKTGSGEYTYVFTNKAPASIDRNTTHTVAVYSTRDLREFDMGRNYDDDALSFVPTGAPVTQIRDVVRTSACNKCHDDLGFHGGARKSIVVCAICHNPGTSEPVTGNTVDLKVMIHKIHMGSNLPSVVAKNKYMIGTHDYSDVANPAPAQACRVCHEPKSVSGAEQADAWLKPSREACGSCHDNVSFATGENHVDLSQVSDSQCANCHQPKAEMDFDTSVPGAHVVPIESALLPGVRFTIEAADNVRPGMQPTVTFTVKDKQGNAVPLSNMSSLRLYMGGPATDISSYVREDAMKAQGPGDGRYFWTFAAALPQDAKGTWQFGIEGYRNSKIYEGTKKERSIRDYGPNRVFFAAADGSDPLPRRSVVTSDKCNKCHYTMAFHGGNRNQAEMCTFCHNPNLTEGDEKTSWNFVNMIHRIHGEEVRYPGNINNCSQCHEGDSQSLPLKAGMLSVANGPAPVNPAPPTTNACTTCHNTPAAWAHVASNTSLLGESCEVCHGRTSTYSVGKVHAQ